MRKREFISGWQERFQKFFEEGITEKFKAVCLKVREGEERNYGEDFKDLREMMGDPSVTLQNLEMTPTGGLEGVTDVNSSSLQNLQMIQTGGLEGVSTAMNSSTFGAMETPFLQARELTKRKREEKLDGDRRGKIPATAYTTPSRPPSGEFMAEARQSCHQSTPAWATQGPLYTNILCSHDKEASTSSWAPSQEVSACDLVKELYHKIKDAETASIHIVTLVGNLMKELLSAGSEFLNLPLLDAIEHYPSLENQFNEGLTLIGQEHPIDDKVAIHSDDPPVVVPRSSVYCDASMVNVTQTVPAGSEFPNLPLFDASELYLLNQFNEGLNLIRQAQHIDYNIAVLNSDTSMVNVGGPNDFAPVGDAVNIAVDGPQFQAANPRTNNVEQEDDAND